MADNKGLLNKLVDAVKTYEESLVCVILYGLVAKEHNQRVRI